MATERGYIKLSRKLFEGKYWAERRTFSRFEAWVDLIQMAAWKEHKRTVRDLSIPLKRGEVVVSQRFLARRWNWSRKMVRTFIQECLDDGRLTRVGPPKGPPPAENGPTKGPTLGPTYLLENYEHYQSTGPTQGPTQGPTPDQKRAHQRAQIEVKKSKKAKKSEKDGREECAPPGALPPGVAIPPEVDTPEVRETILAYIAYRREVGHRPMGSVGWTKLWNRLREYPLTPEYVVASFDKCMASGAQGVFPAHQSRRQQEEEWGPFAGLAKDKGLIP